MDKLRSDRGQLHLYVVDNTISAYDGKTIHVSADCVAVDDSESVAGQKLVLTDLSTAPGVAAGDGYDAPLAPDLGGTELVSLVSDGGESSAAQLPVDVAPSILTNADQASSERTLDVLATDLQANDNDDVAAPALTVPDLVVASGDVPATIPASGDGWDVALAPDTDQGQPGNQNNDEVEVTTGDIFSPLVVFGQDIHFHRGESIHLSAERLLGTSYAVDGRPLTVVGLNVVVDDSGLSPVLTPSGDGWDVTVGPGTGYVMLSYEVSNGVDTQTVESCLEVDSNISPSLDEFHVVGGRTVHISAADLLANDQDYAGLPLSVTALWVNSDGGLSPVVTQAGDGWDVALAPGAGEIELSYQISDGVETATSSVALHVHDDDAGSGGGNTGGGNGAAPNITCGFDRLVVETGPHIHIRTADLLANDTGNNLSILGMAVTWDSLGGSVPPSVTASGDGYDIEFDTSTLAVYGFGLTYQLTDGITILDAPVYVRTTLSGEVNDSDILVTDAFTLNGARNRITFAGSSQVDLGSGRQITMGEANYDDLGNQYVFQSFQGSLHLTDSVVSAGYLNNMDSQWDGERDQITFSGAQRFAGTHQTIIAEGVGSRVGVGTQDSEYWISNGSLNFGWQGAISLHMGASTITDGRGNVFHGEGNRIESATLLNISVDDGLTANIDGYMTTVRAGSNNDLTVSGYGWMNVIVSGDDSTVRLLGTQTSAEINNGTVYFADHSQVTICHAVRDNFCNTFRAVAFSVHNPAILGYNDPGDDAGVYADTAWYSWTDEQGNIHYHFTETTGMTDERGNTVFGTNDVVMVNDGTVRIGSGQHATIGGVGDDVVLENGASVTLVGTARVHYNAGDRAVSVDAEAAGSALMLGSSISTEQLWFTHNGNDLDISVMGTSDHITLNGWYSNPSNHVGIYSGDGRVLADAQVDILVNAMAAFGAPSAHETSLAPYVAEQLAPVIAASWHSA